MILSKLAVTENLLTIQKELIDKAFSNGSLSAVFEADLVNNKTLSLEEYEKLLRFSCDLILSRYTYSSNSSSYKDYEHYDVSQIQLEQKVWTMALKCPVTWLNSIKYIAYDSLHANALTPAGLFFLDSFVHQGLYGEGDWDLLALELKLTPSEEVEIYFVENLSPSKKLLEEMGYCEIDKKEAVEKIHNSQILTPSQVSPSL